MRVVVVGAGLGGLCLANGLSAAGVDVEVLEAQDAIHDKGQGYRININRAGHEALRACLSERRFAAYERTLHRQPDAAVHLCTPELRLISRAEIPAPPGAVDRGTLRRVLADGVPDRIRFGRRVGTLADAGPADLVVAADGIGSALRRELLPGNDPESFGWTAIFGRSPITETNRPWLAPAVMRSRFCGIVDETTVLALCAYDPPEPGAPPPYVMWVLMGPSDELPDGGDLIRFARERTASWDPRVTAILAGSTPGDTFQTPLRAMAGIPPVPAFPGVPVAFLGDAIHAMSPAGGEGANTALGDAALLVVHLARTTDIATAVAGYHEDMRAAAGAALHRSAHNAVAAYQATKEATHA